MIVLSIGGNDLGFAAIVAACFEAYLPHRTPCEPATAAAALRRERSPAATADVEKAIDEIRAVMTPGRLRRRPTTGSSLQTYPSVIPRAAEARYAEIDPAAHRRRLPVLRRRPGLGRDNVVAPQIGGAVQRRRGRARRRSSSTCATRCRATRSARRVDQQATPLTPAVGDHERVGPLPRREHDRTQGDLQETFHPNAYAQRALGACLAGVYAAQPGRFTCSGAPGVAEKG